MVSKASLRIILGDQLTTAISSLASFDRERDRVLLMEVADEASYVPHHKKKLAFVFSAMRHFAEELRDKGFPVDYIALTDKESKNSFSETLEGYLQQNRFSSLVVTHPGEWRVLEEIELWEERFGLPVTICEDTRFFCSINDFRKWAKGKKVLRMENFYHWMRKETGLLMEDGDPVGGEWNYDRENRKALPKNISFPRQPLFSPDEITSSVLEMVERHFSQNMGTLEDYAFASSRNEAEKAFSSFLKNGLQEFGPYQDAMKEGEYFLFHSNISLYLNSGLLDPKKVCLKVENAYQSGSIPIQSAEGYIRQILGWREFIRGIYWLLMPEYGERNSLKATRSLPSFYWSGKTEMNCMRHTIKQTIETATSHHIQRLMVTGNFALLTGIDPKEVCEWYLAVYADAYEWVELPNTLGMALHADGGVVGSKPYAASGAYINRMSNFCKGCRYRIKERSTKEACPFNYLYWNFLIENEKLLRTNNRMGLVMKNLDKISPEERKEITSRAKEFMNKMKEEEV